MLPSIVFHDFVVADCRHGLVAGLDLRRHGALHVGGRRGEDDGALVRQVAGGDRRALLVGVVTWTAAGVAGAVGGFGAGMALFLFVAYLFSNIGAFLSVAAIEAAGFSAAPAPASYAGVRETQTEEIIEASAGSITAPWFSIAGKLLLCVSKPPRFTWMKRTPCSTSRVASSAPRPNGVSP